VLLQGSLLISKAVTRSAGSSMLLLQQHPCCLQTRQVLGCFGGGCVGSGS
jgi:hypothetical protein